MDQAHLCCRFPRKTTGKIIYYHVPYLDITDYDDEKKNFAEILNLYHKPILGDSIGGIFIDHVAAFLKPKQ